LGRISPLRAAGEHRDGGNYQGMAAVVKSRNLCVTKAPLAICGVHRSPVRVNKTILPQPKLRYRNPPMLFGKISMRSGQFALPFLKEGTMTRFYIARIAVGGSGPNAGATLVVPVSLDGAEAFQQLNRKQRSAIKADCIREVRAATHAPFDSAEFRGPVGDVAIPYALGLLNDADLAVANIASVHLGDQM
jgi:hypothetical protein